MQLHDPNGKRLYLTAEERRAFLAAAAKAAPPVHTLCGVLHTTGCRISEALTLTPERVDLTGGAVVVESLKKRRRGVYRVSVVCRARRSGLDGSLDRKRRQSPHTRSWCLHHNRRLSVTARYGVPQLQLAASLMSPAPLYLATWG
jgi:integrase